MKDIYRMRRNKADRNKAKIAWAKDVQRLDKKYGSTLHYVLSSIVPYTEANLKQSFKQSLFFNDLDKLGYAKKKSATVAYYRAIKKGYIKKDEAGIPKITTKGRLKAKKFKPKFLDKNARLLLIFDIPEEERWKRDRLRLLLKELSFSQIQRSVWECQYDYRDYIKEEIKDCQLEGYVVVYEAATLTI